MATLAFVSQRRSPVSKCRRYRQHSRKVLPRTELINDSDYTIIALFQAEFRGLVEYYRLAYNLHRLTTLDGVMEQSLSHFAGDQTPDIRA
jgi:hypothetical protein